VPATGFVARLDPETATGEFLAICPVCLAALVFMAGSDAMGRLIAAGVTHFGLDEPQLDYPEARPDGPPLGYDDLLDLHDALERGGPFTMPADC
jgi:hypothetical protein